MGKLVCGCFIYFSRRDNRFKLIVNIYVIRRITFMLSKLDCVGSTDREYKIQNTEGLVNLEGALGIPIINY